MKIFLPELEIGEREGFTDEKDIFKRKALGQGLTNLVTGADDPLVIALDGHWGSGKSVFLKMWAGELRNLKIPVIAFDAFAHDYFEDPLQALAGEVLKLADAMTPGEEKLDKFFESTFKVGKVIALTALNVGTRVLTAGFAGGSEVMGAVTAVADASTQEGISRILANHKEAMDLSKDFKDALKKLRLGMGGTTEENKASAPPLVIIIDELDRCRPDFALRMLERIKHFFDVEKVHFVLGTNMSQLAHSVRAVYGADIKAEIYLQKFLRVVVPIETSTPPINGQFSTYFDYLCKHHDFNSVSGFKEIGLAHIFEELSTAMELSLREIAQVCSYLAMALTSAKNYNHNISIILGLCVLKLKWPDLFIRAKRGNLSHQDISLVFGWSAELGLDSSKTHEGEFETAWRFVTEVDPHKNVREFYRRDYGGNLDSRKTGLVDCANKFVDAFLVNL